MKNPLEQFKIRTKISILIALNLFLISALVTSGFIQVIEVREEVSRITEEDLLITKSLNKINHLYLMQSMHFEKVINLKDRFLINGNIKKFAAEKDQLIKLGKEVNQEFELAERVLDKTHKLHTHNERSEKILTIDFDLRGIHKEHADFQFLVERILNLISANKLEKLDELSTKVSKEKQELEKNLVLLLQEINIFTETSKKRMRKSEIKTLVRISFICAFILTASLLLGAFITHSISKQILKLKKGAEELKNGRLTVRVEEQTGTELGSLANSFNKMAETLQRTIESRDQEIIVRKRMEQLIMDELKQAGETQKTLLPQTLPDIPNANVVCKFIPMAQVGGDIYDIFELEKNKFGIMVADVTGHGVPAALISFMVFSAFIHSIKSKLSTREVILQINDMLEGRLPPGKYVTMIYGIYDAITKQLTLSCAGHPPGFLVRRATREIIPLKTKGTVLGMLPRKLVNYEQDVFQLHPGDKLLFYTDGILEVINNEGEMLPSDYPDLFLTKHFDSSVNKILEDICESTRNYSYTDTYDDDVTLVGIEILE